MRDGEATRRHNLLAVVPSISSLRVSAAAAWLERLSQCGVEVLLVANARSVADMASPPGVRLIDSQSNPGFATSVNHAVLLANVDWDWVLLLNDDLDLSSDVIDRMIETLEHVDSVSGVGILYFDPEAVRSVPGRRAVFASLSLLGDAWRRSRSAGSDPDFFDERNEVEPGAYKSFSAVAISRTLWTAQNGLDEALVFCYEDAEFAQRAAAIHAYRAQEVRLPINHDRSASTSAHVDKVLPAVAYSAVAYLKNRPRRTRGATVVVLFGLLIRVAFIPFASADRRKHLRGITSAMRTIVAGSTPPLPAYEDL